MCIDTKVRPFLHFSKYYAHFHASCPTIVGQAIDTEPSPNCNAPFPCPTAVGQEQQNNLFVIAQLSSASCFTVILFLLSTTAALVQQKSEAAHNGMPRLLIKGKFLLMLLRSNSLASCGHSSCSGAVPCAEPRRRVPLPHRDKPS